MENKPVGIMSMQRIVNYGSFLQAYALKQMLEKIGHKVQFIDYPFEKDLAAKTRKKRLIKRVLRNLNLLDVLRRKKQQRAFRAAYPEFLRILNVTAEPNYNKNLSTLVVGSDEVFNCMQEFPVGYSRSLFGYGYDDVDKISYAASFGYTTFKDLETHHIAQEVGGYLAKFAAISVRDQNSKEIVGALTSRTDIKINADPVLVADFQELTGSPVPYNNYILVYAYQNRLSRKEERQIRKLAKKYNKQIVSIGFYQKCADINLIIPPLEVPAYFKKADFVVTDTFHGTILSMKMNTNFCTFVRDDNRNKLESLLRDFELKERAVSSPLEIEGKYLSGADFEKTNQLIESATSSAMKYLRRNVK